MGSGLFSLVICCHDGKEVVSGLYLCRILVHVVDVGVREQLVCKTRRHPSWLLLRHCVRVHVG